MSEHHDCPHCGSPMHWKFLKEPMCPKCSQVETITNRKTQTFDDYIASLNYAVTGGQYNLMEAAWNAAKRALSEQNNALTRSDNATNMQNKAANLADIRAQEDLPDLKIIRDVSDGYLYVWEKVRTQWKMKSRYRSWTDVVISLLDKNTKQPTKSSRASSQIQSKVCLMEHMGTVTK